MKQLVKFSTSVSIALMMCVTATVAQAQQVLDRVAVIVDDGVILESQIEQLIKQVKQSDNFSAANAPSDEVLRTQATERLIQQELQLQMAQRMGIEVSEAQLDQAISRIAQERGMNVDELRKTTVASGQSWPAFREQIKTEIITSQVERASVQRRVSVTPREVENLVNLIEQNDSSPTEYRLQQILIGVDSDAPNEKQEAAKRRAEAVIERLNEGDEFSQLAIRSSSGSNALDGGDLGWMTENTMPTLFAEVVKGKGKGELIGPIRSGVGFHILRIADKRGEKVVEVQEVEARHILIKPSVILSDNKAEEMLSEFRQQIINGEKTFAELAKEHSADPGSASRGGDLGWSRPDRYAEEFKQQVSTLETGVISEPFRTQFGWHIVEVMDRRTLDATQESKRDKAYQMLFSRKYREEVNTWRQEMRERAYVRVVAK